jgi:hypothetical protein
VSASGGRPEPVERVADLMSTFGPPWSLCGGWGVDAWLGRETRRHQDVDIAVFHEDQGIAFEHLRGLHLVGHDDRVGQEITEAWDGGPLQADGHIHARAEDGFELEVLLNERSGGHWMIRREPLIIMPMDRCVATSGWDVPTVVPDLLLFWKATAYLGRDDVGDRSHDDVDFLALLPELSRGQVAWLRDAISLVDAGHPWLSRLERRAS